MKIHYSIYNIYAFTAGLIEGAHENRGLGHDFLKHIEKTKVSTPDSHDCHETSKLEQRSVLIVFHVVIKMVFVR